MSKHKESECCWKNLFSYTQFDIMENARLQILWLLEAKMTIVESISLSLCGRYF